MNKTARFVIWICSKFIRSEIEQIIIGLVEVLKDQNPEVKPKDDFKEKHPNYRNFYIDPLPPLTDGPDVQEASPTIDCKELLAEFEAQKGKPLAAVRHRDSSLKVPEHVICPYCTAPSCYIYYNDGKKKTQLLCKVCKNLFQIDQRFRKERKTNYRCPYCRNALFKWKERDEVTIYKCCNDNCPCRIHALNKLSPAEKLLQKLRLSQFKLNYQYREYHFTPKEIQHSCPAKPKVNITKIYNSLDLLGLVLSFYVSFAMSARKTAYILRSVFNVPISYQTVLNYAEAASFYCHHFNLQHKGSIDDISAGDETYIKIMGKHAYVFFFISSISHKITAYHLAHNRDTQPAVASIQEATRTSQPQQEITLVFDGNPSYVAAILFLNSQLPENQRIHFHQVIGLQNLDKESEEFRPYKELIERLNRTFKHHVKPSHGFNSDNGAISLITLFVTHYNFLRPHMALKYKTPVHLSELDTISTIQGKWTKIISMSL